MARSIRLVLVDDHAVLREGLAMVMRYQEDIELVGQAGDKASALALLEKERPDVAVVDLALGADDGLDLVRAAATVTPTTRAVVLTMHEEDTYVREALVAGASGYVLKRGSSRNVLEAIRRVSSGETYLDPAFGAEALGRILTARPSEHRLTALTPRERQVLELVARGVTHREIAERLGIGKKSVDTYRARLYQKLGINSRAELVKIAVEVGLLSQKTIANES